MDMRRRWLGATALALSVVLAGAACDAQDGGAGRTTAAAPQRGGVFRTELTDFGFTGAFDPTSEYLGLAWTFYGALTRTLVSYRHVAGSEGNTLQPDLATEVPRPTDSGLTYTFRLKPNLRFGPPLSRPITSRDVAYAFQRLNARPLAAQYGVYYFGVVKGMDGRAPSADHTIAGIETPDDQTIVFHLARPTGDFLYRVALPATAPIPKEVARCFPTSGAYGRYLIASGPYMIQGSDRLDAGSCKAMKPISGFDPSKKLYLVRNPDYDQASDNLRENWVDAIKIDVNTNLDDIFNKVERGELDASLVDQPPKPLLRRYLGDAGKRNLLHSDSGDRTWFITMNWATPPFDDLHVRKAVSHVIDKQSLLQAWGGRIFGEIATHIMPPSLLGDRLGADYNPYPFDENKAREEMKQSRYDTNKDGVCDASACRNLVMINRNVAPWTTMEPVLVSSLQKLGIQVKPRELTSGAAYTTIQTVKNMIPIALNASWGKDYADAYTFAGAIFDSHSIIPTGNTNYPLLGLTEARAQELEVRYPGGVQIPSVDADIDACQKIPVTDPNHVNCWTEVDKKLMERAVPWVPYLWSNVLTVAAPSLARYEFDQFSGQISLTRIAVGNQQARS
jgi:peptide/nickel transport system substrate-binding protein